MTEIILATMLVLVGFSAAYIRYLIKQIRNISEDFLVVRSLLLSYEESLRPIYETEMFYGEPVLQALVEQTKDITGQLGAILEDYDYSEIEGKIETGLEQDEEA